MEDVAPDGDANPGHTLSFSLKGVLDVGAVKFYHPDSVIEVVITGEVSSSGCGDAAIARAFGVKNIVMALDHDEVLSCYSVEDLLDHITHNDEIDVEYMITQLQASLVIEGEL